MSGKFLVSLTHAKNDSDKATVAFVVANAAVASDKEALVFLSIEAVRLATRYMTPVLILSAFVVALPVYYLVELKVMGMKLRFASEKETVDVRTGTIVATPGHGDAATGDAATTGHDAPGGER